MNTITNNKRSCDDDNPWGYFTDDNDITTTSSNNSFLLLDTDSNNNQNRYYNNSNKMRRTESSIPLPNDSCDIDDGNYNSDTTNTTSSSSSSCKSSISSSSKSIDDNDKVIICRMDNILSSTSCRSFSDLSFCGQWEDVTVGLRGFRIVQTRDRGLEAEFAVILTTNDSEYSCWKPFSCFSEIAEACKAVQQNMKEKLLFENELGHDISDDEWHNITNQNILYRPRQFDILLSFLYDTFSGTSNVIKKGNTPFSSNLNNSLEAWQKIVNNRSIWNKKNLEIAHLIKESNNIDNFLKQLLFDINSPSILVEFMKSTH